MKLERRNRYLQRWQKEKPYENKESVMIEDGCRSVN